MPLIPSRGSQRNIRIATTSPERPQAATTAIAPGDEESLALDEGRANELRRRYVSGKTSEITSRKRGMSSGEKKTPEMKAIGR